MKQYDCKNNHHQDPTHGFSELNRHWSVSNFRMLCLSCAMLKDLVPPTRTFFVAVALKVRKAGVATGLAGRYSEVFPHIINLVTSHTYPAYSGNYDLLGVLQFEARGMLV